MQKTVSKVLIIGNIAIYAIGYPISFFSPGPSAYFVFLGWLSILFLFNIIGSLVITITIVNLWSTGVKVASLTKIALFIALFMLVFVLLHDKTVFG